MTYDKGNGISWSNNLNDRVDEEIMVEKYRHTYDQWIDTILH